MTRRYATIVERLRARLLEGDGVTARSLRQAAEARGAKLGGRPARGEGDDGEGIPSGLESYVDKVSLHAYRVTDEEIAALGEAGYSDDTIFEVTAATALGASMGRLERGMAALRGEI